MPKRVQRPEVDLTGDDNNAVAPTGPRRSSRARKVKPTEAQDDIDKLLDADERQQLRQESKRGDAGTSAPANANQASKKRSSTNQRKKRRAEEEEEEEEEEEVEPIRETTEQRVDARGNPVPFQPKDRKIQDRIDRALSVGSGAAHRLFLLDTQALRPSGGPSSPRAQEFTVLGATGNVYKVTIGTQPKCTCMDFALRRNSCKHILFCFLRVLRCSRTNPVIWQKALTPSEVSQVLSGLGEGTIDQTALATARVRGAYAAATGKAPAIAAAGESSSAQAAKEEEAEKAKEAGKPKRPVEGDCPVCYEEMSADGEAVCTCHTCGNHTHKMCFDRWSNSKRSSGMRVTCVWCRSPWEVPAQAPALRTAVAGPSLPRGSGYLNLASAAALEQPSLQALYQDTAPYLLAYHM